MVLHITPWERSALQLLADDKAIYELADQLTIRQSEVEVHLEALFARMGAANRTEAVAAASRRGLLRRDDNSIDTVG